MTKTLTKEQRAEMRSWIDESHVFVPAAYRERFRDLLDSHDAVDEALGQFRQRVYLARQVDIDRCDHSTACTIWGDDGQGHTEENFTEPLPCNCGALQNWERKQRLKAEQERDIATAKLATATACDKCGIPGEGCPHCTNGVIFSDERARKLLERLKWAEKDSELLDWLETHRANSEDHWVGTDGKRYANLPIVARIYAEGETVREAIRAARTKED